MAHAGVDGSQRDHDIAGLQRRIAELEQANEHLAAQISALQDERRALHCVFMDMPVLIDALDANGDLVFWNRECERVTGYTAEEMLGNPHAFERLCPDGPGREAILEEFDRRGGDSRGWEFELTRKDGRARRVLWSNSSDTVPMAGWATWAVGVDITESKKTREALEQSRRYAEALLHALPDILSVMDLQGRIQRVNERCLAAYGLTREQAIGKTAAELGIVDTAELNVIEEQIIPKLMAGETARGFEVTGRRTDGSSFPTLLSFALLRGPDGEPLGVVCSGRDITQIKEAERLAREKEQMLRATFDAITESVFLVDRDHVFRAVNETGARRLGCDVEYLIGRDGRTILPNDVRDVRTRRFEEVVRTGTPLRLVDRRGEVSFDQTYYPVLDERGQVTHVVIFGVDITDRIRAEKELLESRQRYHDLVENMSDIIYSTNLEGRITSVNRAVEGVLAVDRDQLLGTLSGQWLCETEAAKLQAARETALRGGRTRVEFTLTDAQGRAHDMEAHIGPLQVAGQTVGTQGTIRDVTEQRKAERVIREHADMMRGVLNATTESVLLVDADARILMANETAARRLERSVEELIGLRPGDLDTTIVPTTTAEQRINMVQQVVGSGRAIRFENHRAGLYFDVSMYPVCEADGSVRSVAVFAKDITAQRTSQHALHESEERFKSLVEGLGEMVATFDGQGCFASVNQAAERVIGYRPEEMMGRRYSEFVDPVLRTRFRSDYDRVLEGESLRGQTALVHRSGERIAVEYSLTPAVRSGRIVGVQGITWDITERKRLEGMLRESEERYRAVVESAGEAIAVVDADGVFQFMNATGARRLGGRPEDFVGQRMWAAFPQEIADRQMSHIRRVMTSGRGSNAVSLTSVNGQLRWYNTTIEPLRDAGGKVAAGLIIARDIHELKQAQDELEAYREKMIRAEQLASLGTLSATLAHELTQPLTVIRLSIQNSIEELEAADCPETVREDLSDGLAALSSATAIVERFRSFARRSSQKVTREVDLGDVARRVMGLLEESAARSRVTLETRGLEDLPLICAHEKDLAQLFFALSQNAIQAADGSKQSRFRIAGKRKGDRVQLQFMDESGGIPPEYRGRIFEPFFTTKPAGEGTGLGLCIVQRIVSQAGGDLRVESRPGRGSTFFVTLPVDGY